MTAVVTAVVILGLLAVGGCVGYLLGRYGTRSNPVVTVVTNPDNMTTYDEAERQYRAHERAMLINLLRKTRGPAEVRYEIELADFGPGQAEGMRWRWVAWDADRYLTVLLDPDADKIGREIPAMLGNSETKTTALRDANMWVLEQGANVVVLPQPLAKEFPESREA